MLRAPATSLAELAEYPAPTGMPWNSADSALATPSATRSRLGDTASPWRSARLRMELYDSAYRIKASAMASWPTRSQSARASDGSAGRLPPMASVPTGAMPQAWQ